MNREPPRPGTRLPSLSLPHVSSGDPIAWRLPRGARVLVFLDEGLTRQTEEYLDALREWRGRFQVWDGRPLIVLSPSAGTDAAEGSRTEPEERPARQDEAQTTRRTLDPETLPYPVVADPDGAGRERCGLDPEQLAVIITDRWGEVYRSWVAAGPSALPAPDEIEEWLRFIVTQCPECGVPDKAPEPT